MDLSITKESYGGSKLSWLGSRRGVDTAQTVTIDRASVSGAVVLAGTPLAEGTGGKVVPFTGGEGQEFLGFLLTDQAVKPGGGDIVAPLLDHGRVIVDRLPVSFEAPEGASNFVFVKGA